MNLKEEFRQLFFTDLTESEIRERIGLSRHEYQDLLRITKIELGLPTSFRRNPSRWDKYNKDSYYIIYYFEDDFEIIKYNPLLDSAKFELDSILQDAITITGEYRIEKASDENLKRLIYREYFVNNNNWEISLKKLKIPYYKFYQLLNELKTENNNKFYDNRFIHCKRSPRKRFIIKKLINDRYLNFGEYDDEETARKMRDYLEEIGWDKEIFEKTKEEIMGVILESSD